MDVVKRLKPMMAELELEDNILIISHQATLRYQISELWILILINRRGIKLICRSA